MRLIPRGQAFAEALLACMDRHGIPPSSVCFELSERFDNAGVPEFAGLVNYVRQAGFKLALDDYGAGHGEMNLLCDYQVDYLKIDRHMVSGIDQNPRKRHLFKNTVNMAHALGIRVIGEGVETEAEFLTCRDLGADLMQGWYLSRPETDLARLKTSFPHLPRIGYGAASLPAQAQDKALIRRQVELLPAVHEHDSVDRVFTLFRNNPCLLYTSDAADD